MSAGIGLFIAFIGLQSAGIVVADPVTDRAESMAAFVTALAIPATFSISDGMALGIATYIGTKALGGRGGEISAVMWTLGAVFLLRYLLLPVD